MRRLAFLLWLVSVVVACSGPPAPPTLTPKQISVSSIGPDGIVFQLEVEAYNPNAIALEVRNVKANVTLDGGKYDLGVANVPTQVSLPAKGATNVSSSLSVKWTDVSTLGTLAASNRPVPYEVTGTATVGGPRLDVEVPFKATGVIRQDDLVKAVLRSMPKLPIPGAGARGLN